MNLTRTIRSCRPDRFTPLRCSQHLKQDQQNTTTNNILGENEICFRSHYDRQLYRTGDGDQTATEYQLDDSEGELGFCVKAVCFNLQQVTEQVEWDTGSCWTLCCCLPSIKVKYVCGERRAWKGSLTQGCAWSGHATQLQNSQENPISERWICPRVQITIWEVLCSWDGECFWLPTLLIFSWKLEIKWSNIQAVAFDSTRTLVDI